MCMCGVSLSDDELAGAHVTSLNWDLVSSGGSSALAQPPSTPHSSIAGTYAVNARSVVIGRVSCRGKGCSMSVRSPFGVATPPASANERSQALEAMTDPVFLMSPIRDSAGVVTDLRYSYVNSSAARLYQRAAEDIIGRTQCELFPSIRDTGVLARHIAVLETGVAGELEVDDFDEHGVAGSFMLEMVPVDGDLLVVARDVTDRRAMEKRLAEQAEQLRAVLDGTRDGIARYGPDLRFEYVNRRVADLSGVRADEWIGRTHADLGYPKEIVAFWEDHIRDVFSRGEPNTFTYEVDNTEGHGWWEASLAPEFAPDGTVAHVLSTNRDVTGRVLAEQRLLELATHDALTGLANRTGLAEELGRALKAGQRTGRHVAVLMIDLDRFKFVNDSRGHDAGDRLLCAAAERLMAIARGDDLIARPGGDEFVVIMRDLTSPGEAVSAAWRLVTEFREPFHTADGELFATASIGVAVAVSPDTADEVLRHADAALYVAKAAGRDRASVYNEDLEAAASARLKLEAELRHALERDELRVWFQPEVDLTTGRMSAVEALLRWEHPDGMMLTADRFVDIAEETGLIHSIGPWVFQEACVQAARWAHDLEHPLVVRINLSALQLEEVSFLPGVDEAVRVAGVRPELICAEITESVWLRGTEAVRVNLDGLRDRGIGVAIDDFGTGFASLTYLRQYPVSVLKIDSSFVANIATDERDARLVSGLIALAHAVGVQVTAEGVENESQARTLRQLGCPTSQGFLYSGAVPADQIELLADVTFPHA